MSQPSSSPKRTAPKPPPSRRSAKIVAKQRTYMAGYLSIVFVFGVIGIMFVSGRLVVAGVPSSIIISFLKDDIARSAYFSGDSTLVHDRLGELGIEQQMKEFYRPQIPDEDRLDQHIHQILYDRTGYVGTAYELDANGRLVRKQQLR